MARRTVVTPPLRYPGCARGIPRSVAEAPILFFWLGDSKVARPYQFRAFEGGLQTAAPAGANDALLALAHPEAKLLVFDQRQREVGRGPAVGDCAQFIVGRG